MYLYSTKPTSWLNVLHKIPKSFSRQSMSAGAIGPEHRVRFVALHAPEQGMRVKIGALHHQFLLPLVCNHALHAVHVLQVLAHLALTLVAAQGHVHLHRGYILVPALLSSVVVLPDWVGVETVPVVATVRMVGVQPPRYSCVRRHEYLFHRYGAMPGLIGVLATVATPVVVVHVTCARLLECRRWRWVVVESPLRIVETITIVRHCSALFFVLL